MRPQREAQLAREPPHPVQVLEPERDGFLIQTRGQVTFVVNEEIEEQLGTQRDVCADLD